MDADDVGADGAAEVIGVRRGAATWAGGAWVASRMAATPSAIHTAATAKVAVRLLVLLVVLRAANGDKRAKMAKRG